MYYQYVIHSELGERVADACLSFVMEAIFTLGSALRLILLYSGVILGMAPGDTAKLIAIRIHSVSYCKTYSYQDPIDKLQLD